MRKIAKLPRILKINRIDGLIISVVFNNGESRTLDFKQVLRDAGTSKNSNARILLDPDEFKKAQINNHTLSWKNAGDRIVFKGKEKQVPFEIGADVLYKLSKKDEQSSVIAIGHRLREIREKAGMTQQILAERSGTTRTYISRLENDRSGIELSTLQKVVETGLGRQLEVRIKYSKWPKLHK
jgi:DNA-binding XRE family transcriptional regulator